MLQNINEKNEKNEKFKRIQQAKMRISTESIC